MNYIKNEINKKQNNYTAIGGSGAIRMFLTLGGGPKITQNHYFPVYVIIYRDIFLSLIHFYTTDSECKIHVILPIIKKTNEYSSIYE